MAALAHRTPLDVFISYSHKDEDLRDALMEHLTVLRREGLIRVWHDRKIPPGTEWAGQIDDRLGSAHIVLLLVSPSFMASDYCYDHELKVALERQKHEGTHVIPVLLRPVDWTGSDFAHLQVLPTGGTPVADWTNRDAAFRDVTAALRRIAVDGPLEELPKRIPAGALTLPPRRQTRRPMATLSIALVLTLLTRAYFSLTIAAGQLNASETLVVFGFWTAASFAARWLWGRFGGQLFR